MKTYGEKPIIFRFDNDETDYMIGSEVGNYLRLFRGALYKRFPGLTRRNLTNDERRKLVEMGHSQHVTASSISLLLAKEVDELLYGQEDKFKGKTRSVSQETTFLYIYDEKAIIKLCGQYSNRLDNFGDEFSARAKVSTRLLSEFLNEAVIIEQDPFESANHGNEGVKQMSLKHLKMDHAYSLEIF